MPMETQTSFSFYVFRRGISFPDFENVKIKGNDVRCPICYTLMVVIYQKGKDKFYQCPNSHKGRRFVYMIGE